jgi:plastocyanin
MARAIPLRRRVIELASALSVSGAMLAAWPKPDSLAASEQTRPQEIAIMDQTGRAVPADQAVASGQIFDVSVGAVGRVFSPANVQISVGDTVRWTWGAGGHNVRSGSKCVADDAFCSPDDVNCSASPLSDAGTIYSRTFSQPGIYSYFCAAHCGSGMVGTITVVQPPFVTINSVSRKGSGFVINGRTTPNSMVTIHASPDLLLAFTSIGTATADGTGAFTFTDMSAPALQKRFYRATNP